MPDTRGLLYFDLMSSKMYRCNGFQWEHWGWGSDSYHYASMLQDAAAPGDKDEEKPVDKENVEAFVSIGENGEKKWHCPKSKCKCITYNIIKPLMIDLHNSLR
jgi:hypothetical protein